MPRKSPGDISGAFYRSGAGELMRPPDYLRGDARQLWEDILKSKPADRFDAGSAPLLESFVVLIDHGRWLQQELSRTKVTSPEAAKLERRIGQLINTTTMLATKLRLTVQARVDRRAGELDAPGDGPAIEDRLLGGSAIRRTNEPSGSA